MRDTRRNEELEAAVTDRDRGFTLVELVVVILILGMLASTVVMSISGMRTEAADTGCHSDRRLVATATEAFFAHNVGTDAIPATGVGNDRFEQTLVDGGFVRAVSEYHDLDAHGVVSPQEGSPC